MTNQGIPVTSLSGPPVSRWLGFFPEFRDDSLGFLLRCHAYGDVVKLPMGQMAELLFRHQIWPCTSSIIRTTSNTCW